MIVYSSSSHHVCVCARARACVRACVCVCGGIGMDVYDLILFPQPTGLGEEEEGQRSLFVFR